VGTAGRKPYDHWAGTTVAHEQHQFTVILPRNPAEFIYFPEAPLPVPLLWGYSRRYLRAGLLKPVEEAMAISPAPTLSGVNEEVRKFGLSSPWKLTLPQEPKSPIER